MSWQQDLENDLDWRLAELATMKFQAANSPNGSILQNALLRSLIALLYAHYEGFCKSAIRIFLKRLQSECIVRNVCKDELAVFTLQKDLRKSKNFSNEESWEFYRNKLQLLMNEIVDFERDSHGEIALHGDSNLYPKDLKANLNAACLNQSEIDRHERQLKNLVGQRNAIAHGQKLLVSDLQKYEEFEFAAISAMYDVVYAIIESLESHGYLASVPYYG